MIAFADLFRGLCFEWTNNWRQLRRIADGLGAEFEALPYEELCGPSDGFSGERTVDGVTVQYSVHVREIDPSGDAHVWIDVDAPLSTWFGVKPSYQFVKRPDGSVHYG
jgi:hypothetical protein